MNDDKLRFLIRKKAKENNTNMQDLMKMYFFERLLYRISKSEYKHNFILKGGLLLSAIIGDERRTTQDMDTMLKGIDIKSDTLKRIINEILEINLDDGITFKYIKDEEIKINDIYGGIKVYLIGTKGRLIINLSIDITTKDPITPKEINFKYKSMFTNEYINIMAFNKETIIAEKFETFIVSAETNTRAKDLYDLYVLINDYFDELDKKILIKAIKNTCKRRKTLYIMEEIDYRFDKIKNSELLEATWKKYQQSKPFSNNIKFDNIISKIFLVVELLTKEETITI